MFFKKLFGKDWRHYFEKGKQYYEDEHYADARHAFEEALQKLGDGDEGSSPASEEITGFLRETGNRLAALNIAEAEHALGRGDSAKAEEHLHLALEFASDQAIREKAEQLMSSPGPVVAASADARAHSHSHSCTGCGTGSATPAEESFPDDHLSAQERFEILVHPLPGDLPQRYAAMGEKFVQGYLLVHEGKELEGGKIFQELLTCGDSDILLYEIALINCRHGHGAVGEQQLRQAMTLNDMNPLCYLALVQLLADAKRLEECIPLLNHMIGHQLLIEQAMMYLGDIYQALGKEEDALQTYTEALNYPGAAKGAAERLVVILQKQNREAEAAYLFKRYLKGCC